MSYNIRWEKEAIQELRKLPKEISKRIVKKVESIKENPKHFLKSLTEIKGSKLRIGDHRVIIDLFEEERLIRIKMIGHRKNIYKKHKIK